MVLKADSGFSHVGSSTGFLLIFLGITLSTIYIMNGMKTTNLKILKEENCPGFKTNLKKSKKKRAVAIVAAKREANLHKPNDFLIFVI